MPRIKLVAQCIRRKCACDSPPVRAEVQLLKVRFCQRPCRATTGLGASALEPLELSLFRLLLKRAMVPKKLLDDDQLRQLV